MSAAASPSTSSVAKRGPDASSTSLLGISPDTLSFQRMLGMMRELSAQSKQERLQLVEGVGQDIRVLRMEQFRVAQAQSQAEAQLKALQDRLQVMLSSSGSNSGGGDDVTKDRYTPSNTYTSNGGPGTGSVNAGLYSNTTDYLTQFLMETPGKSNTAVGTTKQLSAASTDAVSSKLSLLASAVQKATEETELLKVALMNDRLTREDRLKVLTAEDDALEQRIRQSEAVSDTIRSDIQRLRSSMQHTVEILEAIHNHETHDRVPPQFSALELDKLALEVDDMVNRVREEHAALCGRMESMEAFFNAEEQKRRETLSKMELSLQELEVAFQQDVDAKRHMPFRPQHYDASSDWLKEKTTAPPSSVKARSSYPGVGAASSSAAGPISKSSQAPQASSSFGVLPAPYLRQALDAFNDRPETRQGRRREELEAVLERFYSVYNPDKLADIDSILDEYTGAEEELFAALEVHYGCFGYFSQ